jgi:hypothetical protein
LAQWTTKADRQETKGFLGEGTRDHGHQETTSAFTGQQRRAGWWAGAEN